MAGICRLGTAGARSLARRMIPVPHYRRSFSAVALADYWTEWEEEEKERSRHAMTAAEACGEREPGGVQWVFMGSPAAQRHVYATRVAKLLDVPYISMDSLVRQELNPSSSLYKQVSLSSIYYIILAISPQNIYLVLLFLDRFVMLGTEMIQLLEEYYRKQKKLLDVQVSGGPAETWRGLLAALHLQHMDTATAQKLTV
ncbi:hypothetical protein B296_00001044 [Ensete ventricosum]|uniref:Adenylate kinase n=1 Tax=Ensete ventricosum TaxID=4639 RepID=A0A427B0Z7_ENSVE|nr:hypothetical protein B296_00001044 [Ensete ventricosum]